MFINNLLKENANLMLTISANDLMDVIDNAISKTLEASKQVEQKDLPKYVHGLQGIADLFGVTKVTAQKYKNTWLSDAVMQNGKVLITDTEIALRLFEKQSKRDEA